MRGSKREVEYEAPTVEYETPSSAEPETPRAKPSNAFDPGYCWCGKRVLGCTGNPTKVNVYGPKAVMFICPTGRDESSITKELYELARKAGLVS